MFSPDIRVLYFYHLVTLVLFLINPFWILFLFYNKQVTVKLVNDSGTFFLAKNNQR